MKKTQPRLKIGLQERYGNKVKHEAIPDMGKFLFEDCLGIDVEKLDISQSQKTNIAKNNLEALKLLGLNTSNNKANNISLSSDDKLLESVKSDSIMDKKFEEYLNSCKIASQVEDPYKYHRFYHEEIYEKVLSKEFYNSESEYEKQVKEIRQVRNNNKNFINETNINSNTNKNDSALKINDYFMSDKHYKFIWLRNFFYELKFQIMQSKPDREDQNKYNDFTISLNFKNKIENSKISVYILTPNQNLSQLRGRYFKDGDIFAFYSEKEKKTNELRDLNLSNIMNKNCIEKMFIGEVSTEKTNKGQTHKELICKVSTDYTNIIDEINKENSNFKIKLLTNISSSVREYNAIVEIDKYLLSGHIINPLNNLQRNRLFQSNITNLGNHDTNSLNLNKNEIFLNNCENLKKFNKSQLEAIKKANSMNSQDILLIQGPPGTGKTQTILGIISLILNFNKNAKIIICAPSNTAIDEIAVRLAKNGIYNEECQRYKPKFIRFGLFDRKEKEIKMLETEENGKLLKKYSLEVMIDEKFKEKENSINVNIHQLSSDLNAIAEKIANEAKNKNKTKKEKSSNVESNTGNTNNSAVEGHILINLRKEKARLTQEILNMRYEKQKQQNAKFLFEKQILENTQIICTTLNSSGNERLRNVNLNFEAAIIDEACQCTEPSSLIPLYLGVNKLIMVGDHMQLPATVFCDKAETIKYNRSLFERLLCLGYPKHSLTIQYRMHPRIRNFIGNTFYNNELTDDRESKLRLENSVILKRILNNLAFIDLTLSKELNVERSYINNMEIEYIFTLVNQIQVILYENLNDIEVSKLRVKISIIAMYKAQVKALIEKFSNNFNKEYLNLIEINTVDSFQGREQDIIIISTVRSNTSISNGNFRGEIGFLNDFRRMNVALSRAKYACYIVGNANTLKNNEYWLKLINHCKSEDSFYEVHNEKYMQSEIRKLLEEKKNTINYINGVNIFTNSKSLNYLETSRDTINGSRVEPMELEEGEIIETEKGSMNHFTVKATSNTIFVGKKRTIIVEPQTDEFTTKKKIKLDTYKEEEKGKDKMFNIENAKDYNKSHLNSLFK